ncbi:MAG: hypothetical protein JNJ73_06695 [Hyphomonadaceae bacterium]|nr:hypothetical protein [Hyphomonadaceae bacterium]
MLKHLLLATALLVGTAAAAQAQSFTFTSASTTSNVVSAQLGDTTLASMTLSGTVQTTVEGARSATRGTFTCNTWTTPGEDTDSRGICDASEGTADKFSIAYRCSNMDAATQLAYCWGVLVGEAGRYAGKTGTVTWQGTPTGATGQGAWR